MSRKKMKAVLKVLLGVLITVDLLACGLFVVLKFGHGLYSKMELGELILGEGESLVSQDVLANKKESNVKNIALFGVDSRSDSYSGTRSDAIMILSYNKDTNEATITSVVRDTYAWLGDENGYDKINHAYSFGGPALAIQALNNQFDLDIEEYVTVNFNAVAELIDSIGGITVNIEDYEYDELNRVILEMNDYEDGGDSASAIRNIGANTLTGRQAVAYMRIRKVGNGDFERMERQRHVIELVFEKISSQSKGELIQLTEKLLPYIKTNLTLTDIISEGISLIFGGIEEINQRQLPTTELSYGTKLSDGVYYLIPQTLEANVLEWHDDVYGISDYQLTKQAQGISDTIAQQTGLY